VTGPPVSRFFRRPVRVLRGAYEPSRAGKVSDYPTMDQQDIRPVPLFVIIIPVAHSIRDLRRCLASLATLDYRKDRFQVVLVDCRVVDGMEDFLHKGLSGYGVRVSALSLPVGPSGGKDWFIERRINEARNYAMQKVQGVCYVFTEDDCTFEPDWLQKFEHALSDEVGILGGPDILPQGMGLFPRALDCVLNSYLGTAGMRRGDGNRAKDYYPRKENMALPAAVVARVGAFPEEITIGGEMDIARRIRDADFTVRYLPDNPVWHWRKTTLLNFIRLSAYTAFQKVKLLRRHRSFVMSAHFFVLMATLAVVLLGVASLVAGHARPLIEVLSGIYLSALLLTAASSVMRTRSVVIGLAVFLMLPLHHLSLVSGIVSGAVVKTHLGEARH
jgi:GT2 family glycosyltransferase